MEDVKFNFIRHTGWKLKVYHVFKLNKIKSIYHGRNFIIATQCTFLDFFLPPLWHLRSLLLNRYSTCSKSPPFEWHSFAHFPASQRTLPHVSPLMPLTSLVASRFRSVRFCGSPWYTSDFKYPHMKKSSEVKSGKWGGDGWLVLRLMTS